MGRVPKLFISTIALAGMICVQALAQGPAPDGPALPMFPAVSDSEAEFIRAETAPRMAPELALQIFRNRAARQLREPVNYSANTVIAAELPDSSQHGEYYLRRRFVAPKTLQFTPVRFSGDNFVKTNVITRVLQAEVDHMSKGDGAQTAIIDANYKFSYKGRDEIDGAPVHVFHVKPRAKRPGLFKGRIYLDAGTGSLRRAEGTLVKTQSFFIKKIEFQQDYADIDGYTLPVHARSLANARLVGRAVVQVDTRDYDLDVNPEMLAGASSGGSR